MGEVFKDTRPGGYHSDPFEVQMTLVFDAEGATGKEANMEEKSLSLLLFLGTLVMYLPADLLAPSVSHS